MTDFQTNFLRTTHKQYYEIRDFLIESIDSLPVVKNWQNIEYFNIPCSFDIETSSFYSNISGQPEKQSIMYIWMFGIFGEVFIGRTWEQFKELLANVVEILELSKQRRLVCYSHNLQFEFQFMRKHIGWDKIFAIKQRKPLYCLMECGIEMRCSYLLSGYSLEKVGEQCNNYPVRKLVGNLDYLKIRHSKTPLTKNEIDYCINDVKVVMSYIMEKIERDGDITRIPLTKTGYVRNYCRNRCMYAGSHKKESQKYLKFRELMDSLTIEPDEYKQLKKAFQGGFTHANAHYSDITLTNVGSYDLTSSYPYTMVAEMFPMSKGELVTITSKEQFERYLKEYCCIFDVEFFELESKTFFEHPLASSKCSHKVDIVEDNGRIVSAKKLETTITNVDWQVYKCFYKWEKTRIRNFRIYKKAYLPTDLVKAILKLYADKTTLKDVEGKEIEYLNSKEMVNACYGMMVTDIVREIIEYENEWLDNKDGDVEKEIEKYNKNKRRFLFYPWGVFVTAYSRRNLFMFILEMQEDYVYSDTDSGKGKNMENHIEFINKYNNHVRNKLKIVSEYHNIPWEMFEPETVEGNKKLLGVWDSEGTYTRFKTIGAKRYMTEKNGKISITVSGLNKKYAVPYILDRYGTDKAFDEFKQDLYIPPEHTGKNTLTYLDTECNGVVKDYLGIECEYHELSGIHMEKVDFTMSLSEQYVDYLKGLREVI